MSDARYSIVIPTIGRDSLAVLLSTLDACDGPLAERVVLVDDRAGDAPPLPIPALPRIGSIVQVVRSDGRGPAAARNRGWRETRTPWIAFLDDDVVVSPTWAADLVSDVATADGDVVASQGRVEVPLPADRAPTDWERNVAGLARARWITADCAYRRDVLRRLGGFDERFPRAFREDADLALRATADGGRITRGERSVRHPVRPADAWVSVRLQVGNRDDALMRAIHGDDWYDRAGASRGAIRSHVATVAAAALSLAFAAIWTARTIGFAYRRIAPGPKTAREIGTMLATSVAIPFSATYHRAIGERHARAARASRTSLALFDRDGTLIEDVVDLRDPADVRPMAGAREALRRLRSAGIPVGVVTNQASVGEGRVGADELAAVNARIEADLGPFRVWAVCTHRADAGCPCRKPRPSLVTRAARDCGVPPSACVVVGDIGSDVDAAHAAGATAILVPTAVTLPEEIQRAPRVALDLAAAVDMILAGSP